jgi:DNA-binding transcriptional ArsR family regulator
MRWRSDGLSASGEVNTILPPLGANESRRLNPPAILVRFALIQPRKPKRLAWHLVGSSVSWFLMTGIDCIVALKALGEETRLRILRLLFKEQLSVNEITERLGASQYNVSKHLRIMREAGLLETRKDGKQRLYAVPEKLRTQIAANNFVLDLGCCTFRCDRLPK